MSRKLILLLLPVLLVLATPLSGKGTQEKDFQEAKGKENFSQSVDLTKLQPGQYNVLVRTKDAAGNVAYAGPFNFYYDPASDNPLITVANPTPAMRIAASLNVVGVSSAPKGTARVEVQVDNDGDWAVAQGKAFWSYPLLTFGMTDGPHTLSVRGVDVNGVVGPIVTVPFHLDQSPPVLALTTQNSGDRVSGIVALGGTLSDGNGVVSLDFSTDNRKTVVPIALQGDERSPSRTFTTTLDTKKFPDGPLVLWFHGVDGQGSQVSKAILLYVDNTLPQISVLSPPPGVGLHGRVRFAVQAEKVLGLKSLTARVGEKAEPVALNVVPGNPFHIVDLDLPGQGAGTLPIIFEATDTAGKVGRTVYLATLNGDQDVATFTLATPLEKTLVTGALRLVGTETATDGPGALAWALNGGAEVIQTVGSAFDFVIPGLISGPNTLVLTPIDINKRRGKAVTQTFTAALGAARIHLDTLVTTDQELPFLPGMSAAPDKKPRLKGTVTWQNPPKSLVWSLGDSKPVIINTTGSGPTVNFTVPFPDDPPFGTVVLTVTAIDALDQKATLKTFVDITNLARPQGTEGLSFADSRLGTSTVVVTPESPLKAFFSGGKIKTAELVTPRGTVPQSVIAVTHDDQIVTLNDLKDGQFTSVKLKVVSDKGRIFEADLGTILGDTAPPSFVLSSPVSGTWAQEKLRIDGQVSDNNGLAKLEWTIDNGKTWQGLEAPSGQGGNFTRQISLPGPDGLVNLLLRATDPAGRSSTVLAVVRRDTQAPTLDLVLPPIEPGTTGTVYAVGRWKDEGALKKLEVVSGKATTALPLDRPFLVPIDAASGASLTFKATDWAGNTVEQTAAVAPAPAAPTLEEAAAAPPATKPTIEILFPKTDLKGINGVIPVIGRVTGFTAPPQVTSKGEATGDRPLELTPAGWFTFETNVSQLKSRNVSLTATGSGKEAANLNVTLPFDAASELPQARFQPTSDRPVLTGNVTASGLITDSRGRVSWISQLDNGEKKTTVPDPDKPPVGTFLVDLGIPTPGAHKLTVIPVNGDGKQGAPAVIEFVSTQPSGPVEFSNLEFGASLPLGRDSRIQGRITSINSWKKVEILFSDLAAKDPWNGTFQNLDIKKASDGQWTFDAPLPQALPYSRIGVIVRGEDSLGQKVEGRTLFHRIWAKDPSAIADAEGIFFVDDHLDEATGRFETVPGTGLLGTFRGRAIKTAVLEPTSAAVTLTVDDHRLTINTKEEGVFGPFKVVVTTVDNEIFTGKLITVASDTAGPQIEWTSPETGLWIRDSIQLAGKISDPSGVTLAELSLDGGTVWQPLTLKSGSFDLKVPVTGTDGLIRVQLRATDKGGHISFDSRALIKNGSAPTWVLVAPPTDKKVNGLTTIIGTASDISPVVSIEYSDDGKVFKKADGTTTFAFDLDFASYAHIPEKFLIRATDASGNQAITPLVVPLDQDADKPVIQIQTPAIGEVLRADFNISGMAFDDDGVRFLNWRLDGGAWNKLEATSSFQIPIALSSLKDNEHLVEMQAEDIYGTKGEIYSTAFKVSLEAPAAVLFSPAIDKTESGVVDLVGASLDRNGIQAVQVSLDDGLTWNKAEFKGKEELVAQSALPLVKGFLPVERQEWEWKFDSKTLKDGTYLVMVKSTDRYGTDGLFTTLVNVDNKAPALTVTAPFDATALLDTLDLQGRSADNIRLVTLRAELRPIEGAAALNKGASVGNVVLQADLPVTPTFNYHWSLGSLVPGWYNLRVVARDAAGNSTYVARNIRVEGVSADKVEILYPQNGESLNGSFLLEGRVTSRFPVDKAVVNLDQKLKVVAPVDEQGYFSLLLDASNFEKGEHQVSATVQQSATVTLVSEPKKVAFDPLGPWIQVTSHKSGAQLTQRPFLLGAAGWIDAPLAEGSTPEQVQAYQQLKERHRVDAIDVSLDNGKTFNPAQGNEAWKYRLESLGLPDGPQPLVFRARYHDGSVAIQRMLVTIAQTPPSIALLTNIEGGRFNGNLELAGFTEGKTPVRAVEVAIRQGDKAGYEVPGFIQGMYLDQHFLGATLWETGFGLTFFQEAVKLQAQIGQTPQFLADGTLSRFYGTVGGVKLIASILQLPAGYFFGPDWSWLSSSLGLGANFSDFSMNPNLGDFTSTQGVFLGGVVINWEAARVSLKDQSFLKSYSWYNEFTLWFISSDVKAESFPTFSTGLRLGLF